MRSRLIVLSLILGVMLILGFLIWIAFGLPLPDTEQDSATPLPSPPQTSMVNGLTTVTLTHAVQVQSGIQTTPLQAARYQPQVQAYGVVLDPQPLLDLHARDNAATSQLALARVAAATSQREYERLRLLNQDNQNVSDKTVEAALAARDSDRARLAAARLALDNARQQAATQWGRVLGQDSSRLAAMAAGRQMLLQVTLPAGVNGTAPPRHIRVGESGTPSRVDAELISASPRSDPSVQGSTYFYRMPATSALRIGMRLAVELPLDKQAVSGVLIPQSAVLWYADQSWVYLQSDAQHFVRHLISTRTPVPGGWFETGLQPDQRVVTQGAQLLLSQELQPPANSAAASGGGDDD